MLRGPLYGRNFWINRDGRQLETGRKFDLPQAGGAVYIGAMKTMRYVYWQHEDAWLGYPEEFPDYWTQGDSIEELRENLKELYHELTSGHIPEVRRVARLSLA